MKVRRVLLGALLLLQCWAPSISAPWLMRAVFAASAIETFEFEGAEQERRYKALIDELRCPKCLNVNLSGSDAPIAKDLRATVYRQLREGASDQQILDFLQARYGDFVLYDPPLKPATYALWFGPVLLLLLGIVVLLRVARSESDEHPTELSAADRARLSELLDTPADEAP
jgi:cytochrome c-type biogenesis protein CcmH